PGTVAWYECQIGSDTFTSTQSSCEGQKVIGLLGWAYSSPPAGVPAVAIYRCMVAATGEHFDTPGSNCEGQHADAGRLGYLVGTAPFSRFSNGSDHLSMVGVPPAGYHWESTYGSL